MIESQEVSGSQPLQLPSRALAETLAKHLQGPRRIAWVEMPLGPVLITGGEMARADVLTMEKSFTQPVISIYEVKENRPDWSREMQSGKWERYLDYCSRFYFATPAGLVKREEVPAPAGLIVRGPHGWSVVRGASHRHHEPTASLLLALLFRGYEDRLEGWRQDDRRHLLEYRDFKGLSQAFGIRVAEELARSQEFLQEAERARAAIGQALGRDFADITQAMWGLREEVGRLLSQYRYSEVAVRLLDIVNRIMFGRLFFADGLPQELREMAATLEQQLKTEKGERVHREQRDGG